MLYIDYKKMYKHFSNKYDLPEYQIEFIHRAIFEMVAETMKEQKGKNIYLAEFGRFGVPKLKYEKYLQKVRSNSDRLEESSDKK